MAGKTSVWFWSGPLPALSLFMVTLYAPFVVATYMPYLGHPTPQAVRAAAVIAIVLMALGTGVSALFTRMPLVMAPAIGLTVFFASAAPILTPAQLYVCALGASALVWLANLKLGAGPPVRQLILENMPAPIRAGVAGGVGALLAETAIREIEAHAEILKVQGCFLVFATTALILVTETLAQRLWTKAARPEAVSPWYYVLKLAFIAAPVGMLALLLAISPGLGAAPSSLGPIRLADLLDRLSWGGLSASGGDVMNMLVFSLLAAFIIIADMVGTPYQMLDPSQIDTQADLRQGPEGQKAIRRSFFVDAAMMAVNALFHVPPSVYYAENHVLYSFRLGDRPFDPRPAYYYVLLMLLAAAAVFFFGGQVEQFQTLSSVLVAPVLLIVGIQIIANALRAESKVNHSEAAERDASLPLPGDAVVQPAASGQGAGPAADPLRFLPTAVIIILTPVQHVGLEWSLPLGMACHLVRSLILHRRPPPIELGIGAAACVVLVFMGLASFWPSGG